jgi:hypothetical protein
MAWGECLPGKPSHLLALRFSTLRDESHSRNANVGDEDNLDAFRGVPATSYGMS